MSDESIPIFLNISGLLYETRAGTLNRYPKTLLGDFRRRQKYYCPYKNEYFFNRHRASFASILFFYQSAGRLSRPNNINLKVFIRECEFFQLPKWAITSMKQKEGAFLEEDILDFILSTKDEKESEAQSTFRRLLEDPSSSKLARAFSLIYIVLLLVSIGINGLKTMAKFRTHEIHKTHEHNLWEIADISINCYFLIEFLLRFIIAPNKLHFFKSFLVWIDFIALLTFIPTLLKHYTSESMILFFTPFQLFRMVRIFRLAKLLPGFNISEIILRSSFRDLKLFLIVLFITVVIGGTLLFNIENKVSGTDFTSVPNSMYWALQTCSTVGYGDLVPTSAPGKFFASVFIVFFIPTLSVPVLSIIVKFSKFYEFFNMLKDDDM